MVTAIFDRERRPGVPGGGSPGEMRSIRAIPRWLRRRLRSGAPQSPSCEVLPAREVLPAAEPKVGIEPTIYALPRRWTWRGPIRIREGRPPALGPTHFSFFHQSCGAVEVGRHRRATPRGASGGVIAVPPPCRPANSSRTRCLAPAPGRAGVWYDIIYPWPRHLLKSIRISRARQPRSWALRRCGRRSTPLSRRS
jgi:hypothetical protein